jgi:hypothetical protein
MSAPWSQGVRHRRPSWLTTILLALLGVVVAFAITHQLDDRGQQEATPSVQFNGTVVSLHPGGSGGCVRADRGQSVDSRADSNCGPFFVSPGRSVHAGERVRATSFDTTTSSGAAVDGYLLTPRP